MANVKLIFNGATDHDTEDHTLECYINHEGLIYMQIDTHSGFHESWICLDKSTAIRLAKTLRTEINKMEEVGYE